MSRPGEPSVRLLGAPTQADDEGLEDGRFPSPVSSRDDVDGFAWLKTEVQGSVAHKVLQLDPGDVSQGELCRDGLLGGGRQCGLATRVDSSPLFGHHGTRSSAWWL